MTQKEIIKKLNEILIDKLSIYESEIKETATLRDDLGADSLDEVELIMEFEREFNITITDAEAFKVQTVKDLYDIVEKKVDHITC